MRETRSKTKLKKQVTGNASSSGPNTRYRSVIITGPVLPRMPMKHAYRTIASGTSYATVIAISAKR